MSPANESAVELQAVGVSQDVCRKTDRPARDYVLKVNAALQMGGKERGGRAIRPDNVLGRRDGTEGHEQ